MLLLNSATFVHYKINFLKHNFALKTFPFYWLILIKESFRYNLSTFKSMHFLCFNLILFEKISQFHPRVLIGL